MDTFITAVGSINYFLLETFQQYASKGLKFHIFLSQIPMLRNNPKDIYTQGNAAKVSCKDVYHRVYVYDGGKTISNLHGPPTSNWRG